ncbi:MAG: ABC transporter ATP-binding protein, partial [Thermonemataceae bacterium]|nr:ABC transporter ATP-binding protein [Thermonemataceae bacterium]
MSDIVLKVENLWKQYRLGVMGVGSLRDDVGRFWAKLRGKEDPTLKIGQTNDRENLKGEYVWALQDINFEVKRGEILGIIGKNGAGKSTLLKILSKVTSPTKGSIKVKGRIASLLEVGTGFHPELTGRENIFLNGAILGMTKNDIRNKFDEIVEFAGVGKYVDTPVKRYSSGMYVRLAFAVAAHLEPEILIVDEVLAVGDAEFQKKAIGKMQDVSRGEGRTVLFVSHNMGSLSDLCTKGLLMKNGQIHMQEKIDIIIKNYIENSFAKRISESTSIQDSKTRRGDGQVRFTNITIKNIAGIETSNFHQGDDMVIELSCKILEDVDELFSSMAFRSGKTREIITGIPKHQISIKNH